MSLADAYLAEFEQEAVTTRKFLERLPEDRLAWKPHEKSMSAGQLARHIAETPGSVAQAVTVDAFPSPNFEEAFPQADSKEQILSAFDASVAKVREILPTINDERMHGMWRLTHDGKDILTMPRMAFLRSILLNHWYHHRGQFGVYLRLLGAKVPSSYGPSGDEQPAFAQ